MEDALKSDEMGFEENNGAICVSSVVAPNQTLSTWMESRLFMNRVDEMTQ